MTPRRILLAVAVAALVLAVAGRWGHGRGDERAAALPQASAGEAASIPAVPAPALRVGPPVPQSKGGGESRWAPVRRATVARVAPRAGAKAIAPLSTRTPEGTTNLVLALDRHEDAGRRLWVRVRLPVLPTGAVGWVPRENLGGYRMVDTHLVVDLRRLDAVLLRGGRRVFRAPVGVGTAAAPTPRGKFYVRDQLTRFRSRFYGPLAFGTSARSPTLTDWPGGGFIGIHGTDRPDLLPGRVSHGCIRLANRDVLRLGRLMPVGTPITIR